jgi:hypothetical protein
MGTSEYKTNDVFGISRELPMNYVARLSADDAFINTLTRDRHVVIYGGSKQGKTCLRKHCLRAEDYITVQCSNKMNLGDLLGAILKQAGYELAQSTKKTVSGKQKILAAFKATLFGAGLKAGGEQEKQESCEVTTTSLELDVDDVNDIIRALEVVEFKKFIVLEDFHYLPLETQVDFAVALKAFHESSSFCFIVVGVWLEENRLVVHNGDLTGRVTAIDADRWTEDQLHEVMFRGEQLLNIRFTDDFKEQLLQASNQSVYIVQESCYQACIRSNIFSTQAGLTTIGGEIDVGGLVKSIVDQQTGRFHSFLTLFSEGFQETALKMYRWLLYPVLTSDAKELEAGLPYAVMKERIISKHPEGKDLNLGNLTMALQSVASLQVKKSIKPIILDYDATSRRLCVVDRAFLIWIAHQDIKDLLNLVGLPPE